MKTTTKRPDSLIARFLTLLVLAGTIPAVASAAETDPPPIPSNAKVILVGDPELDGEHLAGRQATMVMGRSDKSGPLALGAAIEPRAVQTTRYESIQENDRKILRRTTVVTKPGTDEVLMEAAIDMDAVTLQPLVARMNRGGQETILEYDWKEFVVRTNGDAESEIALDMVMLEVGAHDVWMAALPLREGFVGRLPALFGATGTKYWAVPRVVGSEPIDLGDGKPLDAWVVELDWWGMGADNTAENHSTGGGANGTGGPGGKYWVLKSPPAGVAPVVRVRTEVDAETDSVIQIQSEM